MNRRLVNRQWLLECFSQWLSLRDRVPCGEWVRKHIVIPREVSPTHPGSFNPDIFPLANLVYDWFDDPRYPELVIVKSSQAGISQAFQNVTCYIAEQQLGDVMWLFESATKAKSINRERITPMIQACEALSSVIPESDDDLQNFILWLKGLKIIMSGAQSASQNASRTVPFVFCDEGDEYPLELEGGESHAWTLIRERTKLIEFAKRALFSKPRNNVRPEVEDQRLRNRKKKDDGIVWKEFLGGTRHKCFIPCSHEHCSEPFELVWELVRFGHCRRPDGASWDFDKMLAETYIECPACKRPITDDEKVAQILKHREWRPTNDGTDADPPVTGRMSAHISDLYVNSREFPTLSLGALAVKCVTAKTESDRKAFRRGNLALPVEQQVVQKMQVERLRRLRGAYARATCPVAPAFVCLQVDVQEHGGLFKWTKLAFTMEDELFVLDHGFTEIGEELAAVMDQPIRILPTGEAIRCDLAWIDEGDGLSTNAVLDLCLHPALYGRIATCKGRGGRQTETMPDRVILQENRTHKGRRLDRYLVDEHYFKDDLYEERITQWSDYLRRLDKSDPTAVPPAAPRIHFYESADDELLVEFCSEKKDWHIRNGRLVFGWPLKPENGGKNDYADTVKDGLALWYRTRTMMLKLLAKQEAQRAAEAPADPAPQSIDSMP